MLAARVSCSSLLLVLVSAAALQAQAPTAADAAKACAGPGAAQLAPRMVPTAADQLTDAQKQAVTEFERIRGARGGVNGPYALFLKSPSTLPPTIALGTYLQNQSPLPDELKQFAIIITARQWTQQYQWNVHCPTAVRDGLAPAVAQALLAGRRPDGMSADEALVYDVLDELHGTQSVSDGTYARALARFGEPGIVDLVGLNGYYTLLAMVANAARLAPNGSPNLPALPR